MRWYFRCLAAVPVAAICSMGSSAHGQQLDATISLQTTPDAGGRLRYDYLIENSPDSELTVNAFVLDVGDGADLQSLQQPVGWFGDYDADVISYELAWVAQGPQFEIPIGGSGTFSFTSPLEPGPNSYFIANLAGEEFDEIVGSVEGLIDGPAIAPEGIPGDYNGNGLVEQEDLDLVLANWGEDGTTPPPTWTNDLPDGTIDQPELDGVLANWGNTAGGAAAAVPEPSAGLLLITCLAALFVLPQAARRRRTVRA